MKIYKASNVKEWKYFEDREDALKFCDHFARYFVEIEVVPSSKEPLNQVVEDGQAKANKCQDCDDFHKAGMECWRCDSPPPSIFLTDRLNKNYLTIGHLWSILRLAVYNTKQEDQNSDVVYNFEERKHQLDVINEVIGQIERFHAQVVKDKNA